MQTVDLATVEACLSWSDALDSARSRNLRTGRRGFRLDGVVPDEVLGGGIWRWFGPDHGVRERLRGAEWAGGRG